MTVLLDPTSELQPQDRPRAPRPEALTGLTVGLLDISKMRGDVFLDRLATRLGEHGLNVRRYRKPTFARVASPQLLQEIRGDCDLAIEALAD